MSDLDSEWLEALEVEAPKEEEEITEEEPKDESVDNTDDSADDSADVSDDDADSSEGEQADETTEEEEPVKEEVIEEQPSTKEAVKEALQEIESAKLEKNNKLESLKKEVTETLYPEGIDRQLRDKDGDPITGIDDLTKLINPNTGELFTEEEAGAWLLSNQQRLNKEIETVENFIAEVAEVNAAITEGAERVADKYGDILSKDTKLRDKLVQAYDKTLIKDPKTKVTISAPVDVEEFFDLALEPRLEALMAAQEAEAAKAKAEAEARAKAEQAERSDLKLSGKSDNLDPEEKEWAEAIKSYEEGGR